MKKKKTKRKKKKNNTNKSIAKFIKNNSTIITIIVSITAILFPYILNFLEKSLDTEFKFSYLTIRIDDTNYLEDLKNNQSIYKDDLITPTVNNEINKLLYNEKEKVVDFYITYLIITQSKNIAAENVKLNFIKYGKETNLNDKNLTDVPIDKNIKTNYSKYIKFPINKNEKIKIPLSICKMKDEYFFDIDKCYFMEYKPISIEYNNKYPFSRRKYKIREYLEHNVIIDGKVATGMGEVSDK